MSDSSSAPPDPAATDPAPPIRTAMFTAESPARPQAHIIVLGNEKGGTGKSTTALHIIVALLRAGHSVGSIDLDARQGTLSRYISYRRDYAHRHGLSLPMPDHRAIPRSTAEDLRQAYDDEADAFALALAELGTAHDFVVIDTPGSDSSLSRIGHAFADTLITPLNDSFVDLDLLAEVDPDTLAIRRPSTYSEMVWEQKKRRALRDGGSIDWIVMRNRLSHLDARNKREIGDILTKLAQRIRFRLAPGFGERVIFRELFLKGLTLMDLRDIEPEGGFTMSHVAARQEVRGLLETIGLPIGAAGAD